MSSSEGAHPRNILLGVSGGIACYKAADLVSRLRKAGFDVNVVMTKNATEFVQPLTFQTMSENPVAVDTFQNPQFWEVEHIALAQKADLIVLAPATANVIAKLAHGIADDMLTTTVLASVAPLLIAPAMNTQMYAAAATQQNIQTLKDRGASFVGPDGGLLACGDVGAGRMSEPAQIVETIQTMLQRRSDLQGLRAIVTAGPTREELDPVRFLTNRSSGKMGFAIAEALRDRGAQVTLVHGPVSLAIPQGVQAVPVTSTQDLYEALSARVKDADVLIQAAAPADYRAKARAEQKIKKQPGQDLQLVLEETTDVAAALGKNKQPGQTFVGFAAETENHLDNARRKLVSKNLDMICLNDVGQLGAGFDVDTNQLTLVTNNSVSRLPMLSKREVADRLIDAVLLLRKAPV